MEIRIRDIGLISIVDIDGNIDINAAEIIETVGWLLKNNRLKILCNFEKVSFVDYSGLSILAIAYKDVLNHGGEMKVTNVPLPILELLRLVHLDNVLEIFMEEDAALKSFEKEVFPIEKKLLRRRFNRLEMHLSGEYRPKSAPIKVKMFKERILNIGGAGIYINTHHVYPVRTVLELSIHMPAEASIINAEGSVVWIADKELQPHLYPGMGIQFLDMDQNDYKFLLDFVDKNITSRSSSID